LYRLTLRPEFDRIREKFYGRVRQTRLSQAAIDVLALVAYNESLTGEDINRIRGVPSGSILSQLVRRQLLRVERTEGKPPVMRYFTTPRFLGLFGLETLNDLPRSRDLEQN
jgi:segregation and condensation protein B